MGEEQMPSAKSSPPASGGAAPRTDDKPSFWKRRAVIVIGTAILAVLFFIGLGYLARSFTHETTDDAFLSANVVAIAPKVSGRVKKVYVKDNQEVKAGDLLVEIDPRDFEIELDQKKAALVAAEANVKMIEASIELLGTQITTAQATARQSEAEAAADRATADKAALDLKRAEDLIQQKTISAQEYDSAKAAADAAQATLKAGLEKADSDRAKIAEAKAQLAAGRQAWDRAKAQAKQSDVDVSQADLNLSYTHITSPADGRITRKAVEDGDYVQVGQRLMALVPHEVWVTANYKETQLTRIRPGQPVKISIDSLGGQTFDGQVDSIQAGSGAAFSLLPPENAVGNFVKVVQRVPVKITFDAPLQSGHVLGPGMSVEPSIQVMSFEVPEFVLILAAAVLALVVGFLWWHAANRQASPSAG